MTIKFNPLIILFFLTSCGGGSGSLDINQNDDPIINISSNLNEQLITKYVTLSWTSQNVDSCSASGGWTGIKPLNGSAEVQVNNIGVNNFSLNCSGYNGSISISISVTGYIIQKKIIQQSINGSVEDREFFIRYPQNPLDSSYPLVFIFHGAGGNGESELNRHQAILDLIDDGNFIGVFPSGYQNKWNVNNETSADDVDFFKSIMNEISSNILFDLDKVFGIGISNGSGMVNKLGKETYIFDGIAPLVSQQTVEIGNIIPEGFLSVFQVNGDSDSLVPVNGGIGVANTNFMSASASAENWALNFGCLMTPEQEILEWGDKTVDAFSFSGCIQNNEVRYFIVQDSGHTIQFGGQTNLFNQIWDFFKSIEN
tara:strand:- start:8 stop:1114 length:1107 start_codon:yes stop_codon:yes gene_type:complete